MQSSIREAARDTPVLGECDVLVVGGGSAGVSAAVAAARAGAKVILAERYGSRFTPTNELRELAKNNHLMQALCPPGILVAPSTHHDGAAQPNPKPHTQPQT